MGSALPAWVRRESKLAGLSFFLADKQDPFLNNVVSQILASNLVSWPIKESGQATEDESHGRCRKIRQLGKRQVGAVGNTYPAKEAGVLTPRNTENQIEGGKHGGAGRSRLCPADRRTSG